MPSLAFRRAVESVLRASSGGWIAPTLQNGWVNYDGGYNPVGYYKDGLQRVHLRGLVKNGTVGSVPIFTLPVGYLPLYEHIFPVASNSTYGEVRVKTNGEIWALVGSNIWFCVDGISFRAEA